MGVQRTIAPTEIGINNKITKLTDFTIDSVNFSLLFPADNFDSIG